MCTNTVCIDTLMSVQVAYVAFFIKEDFDLLVAARTCPGHSFANPAERVMVTLNLGLQNVTFARASMPDTSEAKVKQATSMSAVQAVDEHTMQVKDDWLK